MDLPFNTICTKDQIHTALRKLPLSIQNSLFPKPLTVLSVSLVNGRFKSMSIINDSIHKGWEKPGFTIRPEAIRQAISDAIQQTEFPGSHISILVEDQRFIAITLQLPPMSRTDLLPILERRVQQEKRFEGEAAWRYHLGITARGKQSVHLEIWPQGFIEDIVQICEDFGLQLQQLAPISSLSESQFSSLPVEPGEATILITMLEGKVMFVAGGDNGIPFLTRHLAPTKDWVPLGERVGTEVNRTIMFINQQINLNISQIWFLGEEERLTLAEVQPHVSTPLLPCPVDPDWKYWLWVGATLPIDLAYNFTPPQVLRAPLRNLLTKTVAATIAGLALLGVSLTGMVEGYFAKNRDSIQAVTNQGRILQADQQHWKGQLATLQSQQQRVESIRQTTTPSVEGSFLSYIGTVLPTHTILNKVSVKRTNATWAVELTGIASTDLPNSLLLLEQLVTQLSAGPYHVAIHKDWRAQFFRQTGTAATQNSETPQHRFTMKGTIS